MQPAKISIKKYSILPNHAYDISVVIPTWNNLDILKICINSLFKNSSSKIQVIVAVNDGHDGSLEWLINEGQTDVVHAHENIGICYAMNACRSLVKSEYVLYANDDMYFLPGWDTALLQDVKAIGHTAFLVSATMIEPTDSGNSCVSIGNYGNTPETFDEDKLLSSYQQYRKGDWSGSSWPPLMMHIDYWDLIGGFSIEFSPGMYSDPDLSMKMHLAGVRYFKGVGTSLVYHFGSKSTKRVRKNKGRATFISKWAMSSNDFYKNYLKMGTPWSYPFIEDLPQLNKTSLIQKIKRAWISLKSNGA